MFGILPKPALPLSIPFEQMTIVVVACWSERIPTGNLPVQQMVKREAVIKFKTAQALGLAISPALLAHADEVIE